MPLFGLVDRLGVAPTPAPVFGAGSHLCYARAPVVVGSVNAAHNEAGPASRLGLSAPES